MKTKTHAERVDAFVKDRISATMQEIERGLHLTAAEVYSAVKDNPDFVIHKRLTGGRPTEKVFSVDSFKRLCGEQNLSVVVTKAGIEGSSSDDESFVTTTTPKEEIPGLLSPLPDSPEGAFVTTTVKSEDDRAPEEESSAGAGNILQFDQTRSRRVKRAITIR